MYGYIYKTVNLINQHVYIGQKKGKFNPEYFGSGKLIVRAIKKHGLKCFKVRQIASAEDRAELDVLEIHYINKYRKTHVTYNIADGGLSWHITHVSDEKRKNQSKSRLKFYKNPVNRLKRSITAKKAMTPEVRKRISETVKRWAKTNREHYVKMGRSSFGRLGKKHSQETKDKIRASKLGTFYNKKGINV